MITRATIAWALRRLADRVHVPAPSEDLTELRVRARLAWNGWPDSPVARASIAAHEARDQYSARAWDRVIGAVRC